MQGLEDESFDWVYSSHCLEHLQDPAAALRRWWQLLKPGGRMLVVVQDEDLYEQGVWPSLFNRDHKHTFTIDKERSWSPVSRCLTSLVTELPNRKVHWIRTIDRDYQHGRQVWDRTLGNAEANIELMVEKLVSPESTGPGRFDRASSFLHSGKLGDIVYALPTVRALGGGAMRLAPNRGLGLTPRACSALEPLLLAQSYIESCGCWEGEDVDYHLDFFRSIDPGRTNLADCHLLAFGLDTGLKDVAWLTVPQRLSIKDHPVAVSRSLQRRGIDGFWQVMHRFLKGRCFFLGNESEHRAFEQEIGEVPFVPTENLLTAAGFISGAQLFVGNQSCLLAIAEGLKAPLVQCTDLEVPNCRFFRDGAVTVDQRFSPLIAAVLTGEAPCDLLECVLPPGVLQHLGVAYGDTAK